MGEQAEECGWKDKCENMNGGECEWGVRGVSVSGRIRRATLREGVRVRAVGV